MNIKKAVNKAMRMVASRNEPRVPKVQKRRDMELLVGILLIPAFVGGFIGIAALWTQHDPQTKGGTEVVIERPVR